MTPRVVNLSFSLYTYPNEWPYEGARRASHLLEIDV